MVPTPVAGPLHDTLPTSADAHLPGQAVVQEKVLEGSEILVPHDSSSMLTSVPWFRLMSLSSFPLFQFWSLSGSSTNPGERLKTFRCVTLKRGEWLCTFTLQSKRPTAVMSGDGFRFKWKLLVRSARPGAPQCFMVVARQSHHTRWITVAGRTSKAQGHGRGSLCISTSGGCSPLRRASSLVLAQSTTPQHNCFRLSAQGGPEAKSHNHTANSPGDPALLLQLDATWQEHVLKRALSASTRHLSTFKGCPCTSTTVRCQTTCAHPSPRLRGAG